MTAAVTGRRIGDHVHPEYATDTDLHREVNRITSELVAIKEEVKDLRKTITLMMGAIGLLAFILPIAAPFIRSVLNIE